MESAASGAVRTKCRESLIEGERGSGWRYPEGGAVDRSFWRAFQEPLAQPHADWGEGNFTAKYRASKGQLQWTRLTGVEFNEPDLRKRFGQTAPLAPLPPKPTTPPRQPLRAEELPPEPSEEEFFDWLTPAIALGLLSPQLGLDGAVEEMLGRLLADRIRAAGSASYHYEGIYGKDDRAPIPPSWWKYAKAKSPNDHFWRSGSLTFMPKDKTGNIKPIPFFGIKLEREGIYEILDAAGVARPSTENLNAPNVGYIAKLAAQPAIKPNEDVATDFVARTAPELLAEPPLAPPRRKRENPVTDREIKVWYRGLTTAQKTLGVLALWDRARADHLGRHLPRKLVEQFGKKRSNGHRAKPESPKTRGG